MAGYRVRFTVSAWPARARSRSGRSSRDRRVAAPWWEQRSRAIGSLHQRAAPGQGAPGRGEIRLTTHDGRLPQEEQGVRPRSPFQPHLPPEAAGLLTRLQYADDLAAIPGADGRLVAGA